MFHIELFKSFGLEFVQGNKYRTTGILLHADMQFDQDQLLKMLGFFFPVCISVFIIKNQVSIYIWTYFWVFNLKTLINVYVFISKKQ